MAVIAIAGCPGVEESPARGGGTSGNDQYSPREAAGAFLAGVVEIDGEDGRVCALDDRGHVYCWTDPATPSRILGLPRARSISVQEDVLFAVTDEGEVYAAGSAYACHREYAMPGRLSLTYRPEESASDPRRARRLYASEAAHPTISPEVKTSLSAVTMFLRPKSSVFFAPEHVFCEYGVEERLACCNLRSSRVPDWTNDDPRAVPGLRAIQANSAAGCVAFDDGRVECFRKDDGVHVRMTLPSRSTRLAGTFAIFVSLLEDGRVAAWGLDFVVGMRDLPAAKLVDTEWPHTCIVSLADEIWCRYEREFATAPLKIPEAESPWRVEGIINPTDVVVGDSLSCALQSDGRVLCWGKSDEHFGGDEPLRRHVPTPVVVARPTAEKGNSR
jgi:hypothetical protein